MRVAEKIKETLPSGTEQEFRSLLLSISDSKLLLGYHFGEWTFRTPTLESGIATCNFAQDELGHVRLLHGLLKNSMGESDKTLVHDRNASDYLSVRSLNIDIPNWLELISLSAVIDSGLTILLSSLSDSSFRPLRDRVGKILQEEKFHTDYTNAWIISLTNESDERSKTVSDIFRRTIPVYAEWLNSLNTAGLLEAGIQTRSNQAILDETIDTLDALAAKAGLTAPNTSKITSDQEADLPLHPDEDIIYSIRGEKNEVYRV